MSGYNYQQLDRLEPAYLASLNLQQAPFTSRHEDRFFFQDPEREQCSNMLQHLTQYSDLLLIVTGAHGTGKTSLLQHFIHSANDEWAICNVQVNPLIDAHQLLAVIAQGFGLQTQSLPASTIQEMLYRQLVKLHQQKQKPVLLIDDAHLLPREALETLFTLADTETSDDHLLRIILFCEPQINIMLESRHIQPLRERITHTIDIPALDEEQTAAYIRHRLAVCGFSGTSPFQPRDIKKIYRVSRGVPARINELAHLHLSGEKFSTGEPEQLPSEYFRLPYSGRRLAASALVISIIIGILVFQDHINNLFEDAPVEPVHQQQQITIPVVPEKNVTPQQETQPASDPLPADNKATPPVLVTASNPGIKPMPASKADIATSPPTTPPTKAHEQTQPVQPSKPVEPAKPQIRNIIPDPVPASDKPQAILVNGSGFNKNTLITVTWTGHEKQLSRQQVRFENANQLEITITVGLQTDRWGIKATNLPQENSELYKFNVKAAPVNGLQTYKWINQQNPNNFTLQLLGTYDKTSLEAFVKLHKLETNTAFLVTQRNNRNWYTLVHGIFDSREAAQQAVSQLPEALQQTRPWVRRLGDIQDINKPALETKKTSTEITVPDATSETGEAEQLPPVPTPVQRQSLELTSNAAWLWNQNPSYYTLQLSGGQRLEALRDFSRKFQLQDKTVFYRTRRNGHEWFVLLYGSYASREQAKNALQTLPAELQQAGPFPRSFANIHAELTDQ